MPNDTPHDPNDSTEFTVSGSEPGADEFQSSPEDVSEQPSFDLAGAALPGDGASTPEEFAEALDRPAPIDEPAWGDSEAGRRNYDELSALQLIDIVADGIPVGSASFADLMYLRQRIEDLESTHEQARAALEQLNEAVEKLTRPAHRTGTLLNLPAPDMALVVTGGSEYHCAIDPRLARDQLLIGCRVLLNEAYVVIGDLGFESGGPIMKVSDVLPDGRLRVGSESSMQNSLVRRSSPLLKEKLKSGVEVRLDSSGRVALEVVANPEHAANKLESVPELPWEKIGGQKEARDAVRDAIELPLLHADLFRDYQHTTPKGILLYGPPGCGKTLLGKATAYNLTQQLKAQLGEEREAAFLHVKGPEILNMWVGESERLVRDLFSRARDKAKEGFLPFIFIDEAESLLGTRRAGRTSGILNTLVPMFCAEMDGIESLHEMVIILASNRADMIDPAILRPGRIDRKIKVTRPDRDESAEIYRVYLTEGLPFDASLREHVAQDMDSGSGTEAEIKRRTVDYLVEQVLAAQFARTEANRFLEVVTRSGRREHLYRGDLVSGAIIASIVKRAKEIAIKRAIAESSEGGGGQKSDGRRSHGLRLNDLLQALDLEYRENDIFPPTDITEDWLKLVDYDPENVIRIAPVKPRKSFAQTVI